MTSRELFENAIEVVLAHEGDVLVDLPFDLGGLTRFGISQRWNPDVDVVHLTREGAIEIYWQRYWQGHRYDELPEPIAIKTFDLAVNLGEPTVVLCLQRALWACGNRVALDGEIGPMTAGAAAQAPEPELLAALRSEAAGEYRTRVAVSPELGGFLQGWTERAYS